MNYTRTISTEAQCDRGASQERNFTHVVKPLIKKNNVLDNNDNTNCKLPDPSLIVETGIH